MPLGLAGSVANYNLGRHATECLQQGVCLQPRPTWRCSSSPTPATRHSRRFWGCLAASLPDGQPDKASAQRHKAEAEQALKSLEDAGRIGSEYGEVGSCSNFCQVYVKFAALFCC